MKSIFNAPILRPLSDAALTLGGLAVLLTLSLSSLPVQAEIRKIVHPDGRVEFTNVGVDPKSAGDTIYKYRNRQGVLSFSDRRPVDISHIEVLRFDCFACKRNSGVDWYNTPLNLTSYRSATQKAANDTRLDEALIRAVIHAESAFNAQALSSKGATGLMQLMPLTAEYLGVENARDPAQNIDGGSRYLAEMLTLFSDDERLATAAYNAGPGAVERYQGIPPYEETKNYVERVQILRQRYAQALN